MVALTSLAALEIKEAEVLILFTVSFVVVKVTLGWMDVTSFGLGIRIGWISSQASIVNWYLSEIWVWNEKNHKEVECKRN